MKFFAAFILLVASINAESQVPVGGRNIITDQVIEVIEDFIEDIRDLGLDPLYIDQESISYALPVPVIFNFAAHCEEILSTGLSDIIISRIFYDVIGFRLTFTIEMPRIHLSANIAAAEVVIFDNKIDGEISGSFDIYDTRVDGEVRIGVLGGIAARTVDIDFKLGRVDPKINLSILGTDLSDIVNHALGENLPASFTSFKNEVDELIEIIVLDLINENMLLPN